MSGQGLIDASIADLSGNTLEIVTSKLKEPDYRFIWTGLD